MNLNKLREKLSGVKAPTKLIASLALAGSVALTTSGCDFISTLISDINSTDPDATITNSSDGDTTYPTDPNTTDPNTTVPNTTEQHSQIYYDIKNSSYYKYLLDEYKDYINGISRSSQYFDPIPYGFLQNEGFDVSLIKDAPIECDSTPYMMDDSNDVYISVRVGDQADVQYYSCYTLKYTLSDVELSDFKALHEEYSVVAPLFVQELSYQKSPTIVHSAKITAKAYNGILNQFITMPSRSTDLFGTTSLTMDFLNFSTEDQYLECYIRPSHIGGSATNFPSMIKEVEVRYAYLESGSPLRPVAIDTNNPEIMVSPYNTTTMNGDHLTEYKNNPFTITVYDSQFSYFYRYFIF